MWPGRTRHIERPPIAAINHLAAALRARGDELINLGQAVVGLPPPPSALERVAAFVKESRARPQGYSPDPGLSALRQATATFLREKKSIPNATAANVMITCGANQAFVNGLLAATNPGDEIIVFAPYYFDHVFAIRLAGCVPIAVDLALDADDGYRIDFHGLRKALSGRTRAVVLVSPGNPTGRVAAPAEVEALCNLCREAELWLFSDETYDLLTFAPAAHISPAALPTACPKRTIVLGSFSKTFALAAWRVGYLYADDAFIEETIKVQDALVVCAAVPSQLAALGALEATDTYVPAALAALARRRDALLSLLTDSRTLDPIAPQGATSTLARITTPHFETAFDYSKRLLAQAGLITVPGSAFGPRGEGHLRLSFGNQPPKTIKQAGERLRRFESTLC